MKKKRCIIILLLALFITIFLFIVHSISKKHNSFRWNYSGTAVVLSNSEPFEFKGMTDVTLDGTVYENGKFFLGDLRIGIVEEKRHYKGNPKSRYYDITGVMSIYRFLLLTEGEEYFNDNNNKEHCIIKSEPAWLDNIGSKAEKIKMFPFRWFEWYEYANQEGNIKRAGWMENGGLYFIKAGENFVVRTTFELIVPGVTTQEEALDYLKENFHELLE